MRHIWRSIVAAGIVFVPAVVSAAKPEPIYDYGQAPNWERFRELAETNLRAEFFDPSSAEFQWAYGYKQGYIRPFLAGRQYGYWTCGRVNAKNRLGGYVGFTWFVVVERNDQVVYSQIGRPGDFDQVGKSCEHYTQFGDLPAIDKVAMSWSFSGTQPIFGFGYKVEPDGAYIASLAEGGPAERAGMKHGMVISHINGLALKDMDQSGMAKLMAAAPIEATFTIIGVGDIHLKRELLKPDVAAK